MVQVVHVGVVMRVENWSRLSLIWALQNGLSWTHENFAVAPTLFGQYPNATR